MITSNAKNDKDKDPSENEKVTGSNSTSRTDAKNMDDKRGESSASKSTEKKSDKDSGSHSAKKH